MNRKKSEGGRSKGRNFFFIVLGARGLGESVGEWRMYPSPKNYAKQDLMKSTTTLDEEDCCHSEIHRQIFSLTLFGICKAKSGKYGDSDQVIINRILIDH